MEGMLNFSKNVDPCSLKSLCDNMTIDNVCPNRPEKLKCDLKSIPAPMHGRWLCNNDNESDDKKKTAGSCVLKCDKGYKTPKTVIVRYRHCQNHLRHL